MPLLLSRSTHTSQKISLVQAGMDGSQVFCLRWVTIVSNCVRLSEVSVNRKRHAEDGQVKFSLKKSRRAEVNFLPDHSEGQTDETLEEDGLEMIEETKKKNFDASLIPQKMHSTFSLWCREVVEIEPLVKEIKERWPALFLTDEVGVI